MYFQLLPYFFLVFNRRPIIKTVSQFFNRQPTITAACYSTAGQSLGSVVFCAACAKFSKIYQILVDNSLVEMYH